MRFSRFVRGVFASFAMLVVLFLLGPLAVIVVFAFDKSNVQSLPIRHWTTHWFSVAFHDPAVRSALWLSIKAGLAATIIALVLGTLVAFGIHRFRFFGRDTVSLMLVLPIALPGIVTGLALQSAFNISHIELSIYTIIVGHATFCMVVVFNNVVARLRRTSTSLLEASSDLGARPVQTFRLVTLPMLSTAIIAGTLLAFALSFDEVIVTTFTAGAQNTLPLWIFGAILRGQQLPEVNAVVVGVLLLTAIPVAYAAKIASGDSAEVLGRSTKP
ncbi:MAG: ABC transporter permease [Acidimicrobiales bacterium]|jgi:putative spermidine/putrescine transport system permease protein